MKENPIHDYTKQISRTVRCAAGFLGTTAGSMAGALYAPETTQALSHAIQDIFPFVKNAMRVLPAASGVCFIGSTIRLYHLLKKKFDKEDEEMSKYLEKNDAFIKNAEKSVKDSKDFLRKQ